jgi:CRP-like cAMP-binding protein
VADQSTSWRDRTSWSRERTAPLRAFSLAAWNFRPLLHSQPKIAGAVIRVLSRRIREAEGSPVA